MRAWHRSRLRARTLWSTHRLIIVDPAPDAQRGEVAHPPRQRTQLLDRHVGGERRVVQAHHDKRQERPHPTDRVPRDRGQSVVTHLDRPPERVPHDDAKVARVHRQALRPHFHKPHHEAGWRTSEASSASERVRSRDERAHVGRDQYPPTKPVTSSATQTSQVIAEKKYQMLLAGVRARGRAERE